VNSVVLSNPRLSPVRPSSDEARRENRYFRIAVTVGDPPGGNRRYVLVFSDSKDGVRFKDDDGDGVPEFDSNNKVRLIREDSSGFEDVFSKELSENVINNWYQGGGELNLLDPNNYKNPDDVRGDLGNVRSYLENNGGQEAFISDITGRVDLTVDKRNVGGSISARRVDDIEGGKNNEKQQFEFSLFGLTGGETVTIDISDASNGGVGYDGARVKSVDVETGSGTADIQNSGEELVFEADSGGASGIITIELDKIDTNGANQREYTVSFTRDDTGSSDMATFSVVP
jgi:hypothetical protein